MIAIRNNTLKQSVIELRSTLGFPVTPVAFSKNAVLVEADKETLTSHPLYQTGAFYIQNLSSQLPALILDPKPGEKILDMCAAPGSKTTQLAALMNNTGEIVANDSSQKRIFKLRALLDQFGVTNTKTSTQKGEFLWRKYKGYFDRVLVDAPCSMADGRAQKEVKALARQQTYLLRSAIACTKSGGTIVYSTCTDTREENEDVVAWILAYEPGITLDPITNFLPEHKTETGCLRIPAAGIFEAFFVARFTKD